MKTIIILSDNRKLLEKVENQIFEDIKEIEDQLKSWGIEETDFNFYEISYFMDLVNDQILDNLEDTFIGYVRINK